MRFTDPDIQALTARMDKLEAQNRKWKLAAVLLGVSSASLVLMAAKAPDQVDPSVVHARTVEARDFVLKDEDGQIRARLTLNPKPKKAGNMILLNAEGPALQFYDGNGVPIWTEPGLPAMIPAK